MLSFVFLLILSAHARWVPTDRTAAVRCPLPSAARSADMPPLAWESIIYTGRALHLGAYSAIRIQPGRTWSVAEASRPGMHDKVIASGEISADGVLLGLPASTFERARNVWSTSRCTIGTETIPPRSR